MKRVKLLFLFLAGFVLYLRMSMNAMAAEMHFGSASYEPAYDVEFPVGIYLNAEERIGAYEIHLSYDTAFLEYSRGATSGGDGEIVLSGELRSRSLKSFLYLKSIAVGDATLRVDSVKAFNADGTAEIEVEVLPIAPIRTAIAVEDLPQMLYCNDLIVPDFSLDVMNYQIQLPYADDLRIMDEAGELLDVITVDKVDLTEKVYATYIKDATPVVYTFFVTWDQPVEETEINTDDDIQDNSDNSDDSENVTNQQDITDANNTNSGMGDADIAQSIQDSRKQDILKAGLFLGILLVMGLLIGGISLLKKLGQKKNSSKERNYRYEDNEIDYEIIDE